jgi:ABC-type uncharacterized transport system substrate-binding protein
MSGNAGKATVRAYIDAFNRGVSDPIAVGFIESYAQPGGNITGVTVDNRNLLNDVQNTLDK